MACDPWPITWTCDTTAVDPDRLLAAQEAAQTLLWAYSGRHLGVCDYREGYWPSCGDVGCPMPELGRDGLWRNTVLARDCCKLLLEHRPVHSITSVTVEGTVLDPAGYLSDGTYLRRCGACWPCASECCDPPIVVEYRAGVPLPPMTPAAMGEVACEFLLAFDNKPCKLPSRVTNITRQGVTMDLGQPPEELRLGLPMADAWLRIVNPRRLIAPSRVLSPDLPRGAPV